MAVIDAVLSPLMALFESILLNSYRIAGNYGLAIILLSFAVNLLLLPIYMLAERLQDKEQKARSRMKGKLEEIKQCFKGQERFMMVQTLYRLHHYHPVMGLRSIGSLLIQIPFFLAAYQFLKHYEPLEGLTFWFIDNLAEPDAFISFGRYTINLLPILMTAVNLMAAYVYTRRLHPEALLSSCNMALLFFVLLYTSASALVLYWTCNNIFSLGKNIVLALGRRGRTAVPLEIRARIGSWLKQKQKVVRTILFLWLFALYMLLSFALIPDNRSRGLVPNAVAGIAALTLVLSGIILALLYYREGRNPLLRRLLFTFYGVCNGTGLAMLLYYVYIPVYLVSVTDTWFKLWAFFLLALPNLFFLPCFAQYLHSYLRKEAEQEKIYRLSQFRRKRLVTVCLASVAASLLLFVLLPAEIFRNAPLELGMPFSTVLEQNLIFLLPGMSLPILIYLLSPQKTKHLISFLIVGAAGIFLLYALVVPFEIGHMDAFTLIFPHKIKPDLYMFVLEGIGLVLFAMLLFTLLRNSSGQLNIVGVIFIAVIVFRLGSFGIWMQSDKSYPEQIAKKQDSTASPLPEQLFSFSKEKRNVVMIILDMANGGYMQRALQDNPQLADIYKGFVWYPNALSISSYTVPSLPSMVAGWNFTPENIRSVSGDNLAQKMNLAYDTMFNTFLDHKFQIGIAWLTFYYGGVARCSLFEKSNFACLDYWNHSLTGYWLENNPSRQSINAQLSSQKKAALLTVVGLLRAVPLTMKRRVYDEGNWNIYKSEFKNQRGYNHALKEWALIDSLSSISTIRDENAVDERAENGTFTFIHSNLTHTPYALNENCELRNNEFADKNGTNTDSGDATYFAQRCALESLGRWIEWLQDEGIYDNTKLIIVSDHGNDYAEDPMNEHDITLTLKDVDSTRAFTRSHILLLVKDFTDKSSGPLKLDYRFMSNADTASIMFHGIEGYTAALNSLPRDLNDPTKYSSKETVVLPLYDALLYDWRKLTDDKDFTIINIYEVKNSIFELENWKKIQ